MSLRSTILLSSLVALAPLADVRAAEPITLYVSPAAEHGGDGTQAKPFNSLEAARDALRAATNRGAAEVVLLGGRYRRNQTFELSSQDGNVAYRAAAGQQVILDGGRKIPASACREVTDPQILSRLVDPAAAKHLVMIDLKKLGVADFGEFGPRGFGRRIFPAPVELFIDGEPLTAARWPNLGEPDIPLGEVVDPGSARRFHAQEKPRPGSFKYETPRAERWTQAPDAYLEGFFSNGFADDMLPVANIDVKSGVIKLGLPHYYGVGVGKPPSVWGWHAVNLLEEIDLPRESYLDRKLGALYFYPPPGFRPGDGKHRLQLSLLLEPLLVAKNVKNLRFEGITFENARGSGGELNGENIQLVDCTVRNLGGHGIRLSGEDNLLEGCQIVNLGAGGVSLSGGNRRTLEPGGSVVRHCDISRVNRWYRTYKPAISLGGVGNRIQHNRIHDCPGQGILMGGNDHVIEYNEFGRLVNVMSDQGAVYMGRNPSCAGNVFRYNYFHHTASQQDGYGNSGIFFDDGASGQFVQGNVFYKTGRNGAIKYHGGQFNTFINNVVIDCTMPIKYLLWEQQRWEMFLASESQIENLLKQVNILAPPYSTRYPQLAAIYETPYSREHVGESRNWSTTAADPLFKNGAHENFQVTDYAKLREKVPGFAEIPWEKIGPLPTELRPAGNPAVAAEKLAARLHALRDKLEQAYDDSGKSRPLWMKN